jgi:exopolysaccharide production protein ExoQ
MNADCNVELEYPPIGKSEKIFVVCLFLFASGGFLNIVKGSSDLPTGASSGSALANALWILSYVGAGYFALRGSVHCRMRLVDLRWLILLTAYAAISVGWSEVPDISILKASALLGTTLIGIYFGRRFAWDEQLKLLGTTITVAAVTSLAAVVFFPSFGIGKDVFEGAWQGIYPHKNGLGAIMSLGCLVCLLLSLRAKKNRFRFCCIGAICLVLLIFAESATSLVAGVCTGAFIGVRTIAFRLRWSRLRQGLAYVFIVVALAGMATANFQQIVTTLGRDESLTGRTVIWALVWDQVQDRPLLGYGYGGFWAGNDGPSESVWRILGERSVYHAHNGLLEVWAECGVLGLVLFALCFVDVYRKALREAGRTSEIANSWGLYLLIFIFLFDLTETAFMQSNHLLWILFVATIAGLARNKRMPPEIALR